MARTARRMRVIIGEPGLRVRRGRACRRRTGIPARSSCCTRGAACHRDCWHPDPYASPESNPGGTHSGGAGDGDGSACERTRIARRHGTDGAVNEGHRRGDGTVSGAAARVGDAQVFSSVIVLYSGGSVPSRLLSYRYLRQPGIEPGGEPQRRSGRRRWVSVRADADRAAPWHGRRGE